MYETFTLKKVKNGKIEGYSWHVDDPEKVVCIIHGIGEYGGRYDRVASNFAKANIASLAIDLRGHGNSVEKKGHCAPRMDVLGDIDDFIDFASEKYPGKDIILYGHSMGGNIVLDYRCRGGRNDVPVGYVISAPWVRLVNPIKGPIYVLGRIMNKIAPSMTVSSAVDEEMLGNPDSVKPYKDNPMVHGSISFACAFDGMGTGKALEDGTIEDNGRAALIPTVLMHGTEDRICDIAGTRQVYSRLNERGDNVKMIEWENLRHEIHNGGRDSKGDEVIERIKDFILTLE